MSDAFAALCRYMPEWMAHRGAALLGALPQEVERWVQDAATEVEPLIGPPDPDALKDEIVRRFCERHEASEQASVVSALRSAVLLVAIRQMPAPEIVPGEETTVPADTQTKKMGRVALKRSRMLGMLEAELQGYDQTARSLLEAIGR